MEEHDTDKNGVINYDDDMNDEEEEMFEMVLQYCDLNEDGSLDACEITKCATAYVNDV